MVLHTVDAWSQHHHDLRKGAGGGAQLQASTFAQNTVAWAAIPSGWEHDRSTTEEVGDPTERRSVDETGASFRRGFFRRAAKASRGWDRGRRDRRLPTRSNGQRYEACTHRLGRWGVHTVERRAFRETQGATMSARSSASQAISLLASGSSVSARESLPQILESATISPLLDIVMQEWRSESGAEVTYKLDALRASDADRNFSCDRQQRQPPSNRLVQSPVWRSMRPLSVGGDQLMAITETAALIALPLSHHEG